MVKPCSTSASFLVLVASSLVSISNAGFCGYNSTIVKYDNCFECDANPSDFKPICNSQTNGVLVKGVKNGLVVDNPLCSYKCPFSCNVTSGVASQCCVGYHGPKCDIDVDACVSNPCATNETCTDLPAPASVMGQYDSDAATATGRTCRCSDGYSGSPCILDPSLITELNQSFFDQGTLLITKPGLYKLSENISFNPNSKLCDSSQNNMPRQDQFQTNGGIYDRRAFGLGFFAAISIQTSNVTLDLNGFSLEQSVEHALQQRFFALIELNNAPFHYDQGPHNFTIKNRLDTVSGVTIKNGRLGRSSHHGIHGHAANDTTITNLIIEDFEVAGISINGPTQLNIDSVVIGPSRHDVPVKGVFSTGRFILPYVQQIVAQCPDASITLKSKVVSGKEILRRLTKTLDDTYDAVVKGKGTIPTLVNNYIDNSTQGLPDGSAIYGIVLATYGSHTNGFTGERENTTCLDGDGEVVGMLDEFDEFNGLKRCQDSVASGNVNVRIKNVKIVGLDVNVNEVEAVKSKTFDKNLDAPHVRAAVDVVGAVYQYEINVDNQGFVGNPISDAQLFVSTNRVSCMPDNQAGLADKGTPGCQRKAADVGATCQRKLGGNESKLSIFLDTIPQSILTWASQGGRYNPPSSDFVICGGDNMFHVNKGAMGLRIDGADGVLVQNIEIDTVRNMGNLVSSRCGIEVPFLHPEQTQPWYTGTDAIGLSISAGQNIELKGTNFIRNIISAAGNAYGMSIMHVSDNVNGKVIMGRLSAQLGASSTANQDKSPTDIYAARPALRPNYKDSNDKSRLPVAEVIFMDDYACIPGDGMDFDMTDPMNMNMAMAPTFNPLTMTCDIITDLEFQKDVAPWTYTPQTPPTFQCDVVEAESLVCSSGGCVTNVTFFAVVILFVVIVIVVATVVIFKIKSLKAVRYERPGSLSFNNPVSINEGYENPVSIKEGDESSA